ncbi:uncharacterized protein [Rutidosis leptorrhynchoides]|uniref:uncharacterized protein n=1 Tax=Rutidosis leptorrhynchoides TaxID=125765 RepID=UPI003A99AC39
MAEPPPSGNNISSDHLQTWILKVYIHCEGCKKKVFKVLQSIDGVYKTVIDSKQHKATVTGSVNGETLVQKLLKSGKHAQILPESFGPPAAAKSENDTGSQKKKKKQNNKNKQNDQVDDDDDDTEHIEIEESEFKDVMNDENDSKNDQEIVELPVFDGDGNGKGKGGGKKKKKKNKNKKGNNNNSENKAPQNGDIENDLESSMEKLNMDTPSNQTAYATPYDVPAYHNYYPIPAYGMSYNTSYPSTESSYYTPPVYGYAQSHPSGFNSVRPPISYYGRSAFDDVIDEGGDRRFCVVM